MCTVASPGPDPDPNPRGGGQLPNPNECNSTLRSTTRGETLTPNPTLMSGGHQLRILHALRRRGLLIKGHGSKKNYGNLGNCISLVISRTFLPKDGFPVWAEITGKLTTNTLLSSLQLVLAASLKFSSNLLFAASKCQVTIHRQWKFFKMAKDWMVADVKHYWFLMQGRRRGRER